ncbi:MAG: PAS domain S-box protein, partial [Polyangia bacterium]|nr:PAS domain S-box protein [Polyangia bacterium]
MTQPRNTSRSTIDVFGSLASLLERRERLLEAVSTTAEWLLMRADWHLVVERCLERLGEASGASRAYLHQNSVTPPPRGGSLRRFEWCAGGVQPLRDLPLAGDESYEGSGLGRWAATLERGQGISGLVAQLPEPERQALAPHGSHELLVMPVFVGGKWWGYLGLDSLGPKPLFADVEHTALRAVARILGAAIGRRLSEEALAENEERYRKLVENARDLVYVHDLQGRFISVNQAGLDLTGFGREEITGLSVADIVSPEFVETARQQTMSKLSGSAESTTYELEILAKDGRRIAVEVASSLVLQDGRPVAVQGIARDITDRRRLEAQLRQAQKMEAVGRLAGGVAHDFNNILTVISGYSEALLAQLGEGEPLREPILEIARAGSRAAELTQQLLAFSRRSPMQSRMVMLDVVVKDLERMLQRVLGEHLDLITNLGAEGCYVRADPAQLEQIILNLVLNARDAMSAGGTLTISTSSERILEPGKRQLAPGEYVVLAVEDTGCGMPEEVLVQVFEPFFTTKEPGKGTGLGLSTAYGIVRQSGGHISAQSDVGRGSRFEIYLPRQERPVSTKVRIAPAAPRRAARGRVLVTEDELSLRQMVQGMLSDAGYEVVVARDGAEALSHFGPGEAPFDLLITDVVMPGMSGTELADEALR